MSSLVNKNFITKWNVITNIIDWSKTLETRHQQPVIIKYALFQKYTLKKILDNEFLVSNKCQHIRDMEKTT